MVFNAPSKTHFFRCFSHLLNFGLAVLPGSMVCLSEAAVCLCFQEMIKKTSIYSHPLIDHLMEPEVQEEAREDHDDKQVVSEIMARCFIPTLVTSISWEAFHFVGHEIRITEAKDCYGAVVWPSALVLCYFLETNAKQYNMVDKNVIEIGAGTGLVSIVASLLGARVTATDLPELLGNLQYNISCNTKMKCKHLPQVKELSWGVALDKNFPRASNSFDYVLAADVVYAHPFLEDLLLTFDHLCKETTIVLWAMKFSSRLPMWTPTPTPRPCLLHSENLSTFLFAAVSPYFSS
ncbi:protein-lysine methyltransferase METTL21E isoform X2 [Urocitellus parryii]